MFRKICLAAALPLITAALPQGGSESDMESLPKIEEKLKKRSIYRKNCLPMPVTVRMKIMSNPPKTE